MTNIQAILQSTQRAGKTFVQNNRTILEPIGVATGIATAVVTSIAIGQGLLFSKGAATIAGAVALGGAKSSLPIKAITAGGATTAKAAGTAGAAKAAGAVGAAKAVGAASTPAIVQGGAAANQTASLGTLAAPVSKVTTGLLNSVAKSASPLIVGAAGGGAAGWVGTQQIRQAEARIREQEEGLWQELSEKLTKERPELKRKEEAGGETGEKEIRPPSTQPPQGPAQSSAATTAGDKQPSSPVVRPAPPSAGNPLLSQPAPQPPAPAQPSSAQMSSAQPDRLERIKGIGPIFAQLLNAAGVTTFAQLATQTPDQVHQFIAAEENSHMADVESWIAQAQQFANPGGNQP